MFGKKTESQMTPAKTNNSLLHNSLVQGSRLEGNVTSENDFRIDGEFVGNLKCKARVIIGPAGDFKGEIECENAIIEGKLKGKLLIHQVLEVREGAFIEGDVNTNKLMVQAGSVFDVKCNMGDKQRLRPAAADEGEEEAVLSEIENGQFE